MCTFIPRALTSATGPFEGHYCNDPIMPPCKEQSGGGGASALSLMMLGDAGTAAAAANRQLLTTSSGKSQGGRNSFPPSLLPNPSTNITKATAGKSFPPLQRVKTFKRSIHSYGGRKGRSPEVPMIPRRKKQGVMNYRDSQL